MCGFLFTHFKKSPPKGFEKQFKASLSHQSYRGRDDSSFTQVGNSFFGHVRLAIIDLSPLSCQPLEDQENVLLFNGEIFNYQEFDSKSTSDVQTLFAQLKKQKESFLPEIEGFFSLLFFSKATNQFFLSRDAFGEKPLYYYDDEQVFIASSTLKSLVHQFKICLEEPTSINLQSVKEFLAFGYIREPSTIYENISSLPCGHLLSLSGNEVSIKKWENTSNNTSYLNWDQFINKAISVADVPAHLLLSSGVDSTYLLAKAKEFDSVPEIFIYENTVDRSLDESKQAVKNLSKIAPTVVPNIVTNENHLKDLYQDFIETIEQPTSDGLDILNILKGVKRKNQNAKLVLTGLGGDELFGGYPSFVNYGYYQFLSWIPKLLLPRKLDRFKIRLKKEKEFPVAAYYFKYRLEPQFEKSFNLLIINELFKVFLEKIKTHLPKELSTLEKIKRLETFDYMLNQLLRDADNISMKMGIEVRNPFLYAPLLQSKPDNKSSLKKFLSEKHQIRFGAKKGFSLGESQKELIPYFLSEIKKLEIKFSPLIQSLQLKQLPSYSTDFSLLKKWFILLKWLEFNSPKK